MPDLSKLHNLAGQLRDKAKPHPAPTTRRWYKIENRGDRSEVYLYDSIGESGVTARDFTDELRAITTPTLTVHLSCEGGEVWDGLAIYEALKQHPARVRSAIDSLAASAGSFIAMAADPYDRATDTGGVVMARNARMMIHDAAIGGAFGAGNARDLRMFQQEVGELADILDDMSDNIADIYAQRAGGTAAQWRAQMAATTWYSATEAKAAGLVDAVLGEDDPQTSTTPVDAEHPVDVTGFLAMLKEAFNA